MGGILKRHILTLGIGLAPVVLLPLTWAPGGIEPWMRPLRTYAAPVLLVEHAVILYAVLDGMLDTIKRIRLPRIAAIAALVLCAIAVGTTFFAPSPLTALVRTVLWVVHVLFGLAILHLAGRAFDASDLVRAYAVGLTLFIAGFAFLVSQVDRPGFDWTHGLPAVSHIRQLGYYAVAAACLGMGLMAVSRKAAPWTAGFALASIAFACALWTGSRGTLVGTAGALVGGLVFVPATRRTKAWGGAVVSLAAAWLAVSELPAPAPNMGAARTVQSTSDKLTAQDLTTGRTIIWRRAANAVEKRPVFGYGEGQMRFVAPFYEHVQPHNVLLQILLAWGAAGLLCVVILATFFARGAVRVVRSSPAELLPAFAAATGLASMALIDGSLYQIPPLSIFAACAGLIGSHWLRSQAVP